MNNKKHISVYPVDIDNQQGKLYDNITQVLLKYYNEKHPDVTTRHYTMDILSLFQKFIDEQLNE